MPRKEALKFSEFLYHVDDEQKLMVLFCGLEVTGTQEAISCIANDDLNNMMVVGVGAEDDCLKVWVKDGNA